MGPFTGEPENKGNNLAHHEKDQQKTIEIGEAFLRHESLLVHIPYRIYSSRWLCWWSLLFC